MTTADRKNIEKMANRNALYRTKMASEARRVEAILSGPIGWAICSSCGGHGLKADATDLDANTAPADRLCPTCNGLGSVQTR